ncbi:pyrroloquinoline quinone precursor peptide PqqA [Methylomarinovum caldicuralii]
MAPVSNLKHRSSAMTWQKPTYRDLRLGFEVTLYIHHR